MITKYHNSFGRRVALTLLAAIFVFGMWSSPLLADECDDFCASPRTLEDHVMPEDMNPEDCPKPIPLFCFCPSEACDSATVAFTDWSTGYIDTWEWDFGDPASGADNYSNQEYPVHFYSAPGNYTVTLTVTGCGGTQTKVRTEVITIRTSPTADFIADPLEGCAPLTVQFTSLSTHATWWGWNFGDPAAGLDNRAYGPDPVHVYNDPGVYTVRLIVQNDCGKDSLVREEYIIVHPPVTADFSATPTSGYAPLAVDFTDNSVSADPIIEWEWDFGDGSPVSTVQNPTHIYAAAGWYTVTLYAATEWCDDLVEKVEYIEVLDPCTVDFTGTPLDICVEETVDFSGTVIGSEEECVVDSWTWDFGDPTSGANNTGTGQYPSHTYNTAGLFTVILTADVAGTDTVITRTDYVTVHDGPTAAFDATPMTGMAPLTVQFTNQSISPTNSASYTWRFGDNSNPSSDTDPTHTYNAPGVYEVILEVQDRCGIESAIDTIRVGADCTVDFTGDPLDICVEETVDFTGTVYGECQVDSWTWDFGDPTSGSANTGTGQYPSHTYNTAGLFTVVLTANVAGTDTTITKTDYVTVHDGPTADFSATPMSGNAPLTVQFTNQSISPTASEIYTWRFGDNSNPSSDTDPTHTYNAPGVYEVILEVQDRCGIESAIDTIRVGSDCTVNFFADPEEICEGEKVYFSTTFYNFECDVDSWIWDFGDPASGSANTGTGTNPDHIYNSAGLYTVSLTVTGPEIDTTITKTDFITVYANPTADFSATPLTGLAPLTVDFTDLSVPANGNIVSWSWNFGDGSALVTGPDPTHTYQAAGDYTVTLEVEDEHCPDSEVKELYIHVDEDCQVGFYGEPLEICEGETSYFTATFYNQECVVDSWVWDFGDPGSGSANTGTGTSPEHVYNTPGLYTVTMTVTGPEIDTVVTMTDYVTVNASPTADFNATPYSGWVPLTVDFTDMSTTPNGSIVSWDWDFDDGGTSDVPNPTHTFTADGHYTVTLEVFDGVCYDTATTTIYANEGCEFDLVGEPREICEDDSVYFAGIVNGECDVYDWNWDFGDGTTGTGQYVWHTYDVADVYTVTLTITDTYGDRNVVRDDYITVYPNPTADFSATPMVGVVPLAVAFTDLSTSAAGIVSWFWDFGDGTTSNTPNPTHTFTTVGDHTVRLVVSDELCEDEVTKTIHVDPGTDCQVDFMGEPLDLCVGETAYFNGIVNGECTIDSWTWDFGDPDSGPLNTGSGQHVEHQYDSAGVYSVTMTATGPELDSVVTKTNYVTVTAGPTAAFSGTPLSGMAPLTVTFTDLSTSPTNSMSSWFWNFGDGNYSRSRNPIHTYSAAGDYTVILQVEDRCGIDTEVKEVYIHVDDPCKVDFFGEPLEICEGKTVYFTGVVLGECEIDSWTWDFGDPQSGPDNIGTGQYPEHQYDVAGLYTVIMTANVRGTDTVLTKTNYVTVNPGPTANFGASPLSGLAPLTVNFTDSSISQMGIFSWDWDFGDGTPHSALQDPTHVYADTGTYTVSLTVEDECGPDTKTREAYIYVTECSVDFTGMPLEVCEGDDAHFSATSTGPCQITSWTWDFGDPASGSANIGTGQTPVHTYNTAGVYTITLTATDATGSQVLTKNDYVTVNAGPTAAFDALPLSGMAPLTVDFTDQSFSTLGINYRQWNFDDGGHSNDVNPTHTFDTIGVYNVSLLVDGPCGEDTAWTTITVGPAISITKAVDRPFAAPNDELMYTLTVHNHGDEPTSPVLVTDAIPDSTRYVAGTASSNGQPNNTSSEITWSLPPIAAHSSADVSFRVAILDYNQLGTLPVMVYNQAFATIDDGGIATSIRTFPSNIVETKVDAGQTSELGISKTVNPTKARPRDPLTYTITVTNDADNPDAVDVVLYDAIPDSTTYEAGSISAGGTYSAADDSLHWDLGTLAPNTSATVSFRVTVNSDCSDGSRIPNTALVRYFQLGLPQGAQSNEVETIIGLDDLIVTKSVNRPSGMVGDLVRYTITVENYSSAVMENVRLLDTLPAGIFYVDGTSMVDGIAVADPTGSVPIEWSLGDLAAGGTFTVQHVALIGASAHPAYNENVAQAFAMQGANERESNLARANVYVIGHTLSGSIRGRVIVDCDGDGIADTDSVPSGMDIFLDEGSQSKVNNKGMFYFSTVRPGERVVALDERDLVGYYVPEDAQASVFVHVHETGESYVVFRICPEYPLLDLSKRAAIVPTVKVTKVATLDAEQPRDSLGVLIDYQIDIASNGLADPTQVRVVDSFPDNMHLILAETETLAPREDGNKLIYEVTAAQERLEKSVYYSLRDITPGVRKFLNNRVHIESDLTRMGEEQRTMSSAPAEVAVGPMMMAPPRDIQITLTPALFKTSFAILRPEAIPELQAVADSIALYSDADIKVEGHTDFRPIHTEEFPSNWELGEARAKVVVDWLVESRDVARDRLEYESFAATRPVVVDVARTSPALQPNRRTEVIIRTGATGFFAPAAMPVNRWESSTSLALEPVNYDTLFEPAPTPMVAGLDDTWVIVLTVENQSAMAAEKTTLTDIMPDGVVFVDGSATIDGVSTAAVVDGKNVSFELAGVNPGQVIVLRYHVTAVPGTTPNGGGAASVEVQTSTNQTVVLKSNEVRFQ